MTYKPTKKMHGLASRFALVWCTGILEALLGARLVVRLLAARPTNPTIALLTSITDPVVAPLLALNTGLPMFGAVLDRATLAAAIIVPLAAYLAWIVLRRTATSERN